MAETTASRPPFHLELRSVGDNALLADEAIETADRVARVFIALAHRSGPAVYGPAGTHRLVIPASRQPLFAPDEAAWQASAARRKAGV